MRGDIRGFGRGKSAPDIRDKAGRVDLRADDEEDARVLSMLYRVMFNVGLPDDSVDSRALLVQFLEEETGGAA